MALLSPVPCHDVTGLLFCAVDLTTHGRAVRSRVARWRKLHFWPLRSSACFRHISTQTTRTATICRWSLRPISSAIACRPAAT